MQRPIILASGSPRRAELLNGAGIDHTVVEPDLHEDITRFDDPGEAVETLSREKAEAVAGKLHEPSIVIAADTVVYLEGDILVKPRDREEAIAMLTRLQGNDHTVLTGIAVLDTGTGNAVSDVIATKITLRSLTPEEVERYVDSQKPFDKAGAYAIQGVGATFTERIVGEYSNVVGLPMCRLTEILRDFGVTVL
jgi:septum formation protein